MIVVTKLKSSKLSCDKLGIIGETDDTFEVLTYNFFKQEWQKKSRLIKKRETDEKLRKKLLTNG